MEVFKIAINNKSDSLKSDSLLSYVLILIISVLFILVIIQTVRVATFKNTLMEIRNNMTEQNNQLKEQDVLLAEQFRRVDELERYGENLSDVLNQYNIKSRKLENKNVELSNNLNDLMSELHNYDAELDKRLRWFGANSDVNNKTFSKYMFSKLENDVYEVRGSNCVISLGGLDYVNKIKLQFNYIADEEIYDKMDFMPTLEQMYANKGGDCEDYANFYKAEINGIIEKCGPVDSYVFRTYKTPGSSKFYVDKDKEYYLDDVDVIEFRMAHVYPYVMCGSIYDANSEEFNGHCILGLSENMIKSSEHINKLENSYLIEPQTSEYYGRYDITSEEYIESIEIVISDDDLFQLVNGKWVSFSELSGSAKQFLSVNLSLNDSGDI